MGLPAIAAIIVFAVTTPTTIFASTSATSPTTSTTPDSNINMDTYYNLKKKNPTLAKHVLQKILQKNPTKVEALEEMGYLLIDEKKNKEALPYFLKAEQLAPNKYEIKSQLGSIYQNLEKKRQAFYKFKEAAASPDSKLSIQSKKEMAGLAGSQFKILPDPYFMDLYFSPYYLPRFADWIAYSQFRIGRNMLPNEKLQVYGTIYYNEDSRSGATAGALPSIVSDNYISADAGFRLYPFNKDKFPLYGYVEYGQAYNIIPDPFFHQGHTEFELRGGFDFYKDWGEGADYADKLTSTFKHQGDFYADFTYYSRYANDWIGQYTLREGVKLLEYKFSSIGAYWKVNGYVDTNRYYYNNAIETGPCISIIPYNLVDIRLRLELTRGYYIPVRSSVLNPYGPIYNSSYVMLEGYIQW